MSKLDPADFIITRKRKKYRFALFANSELCFELDEWDNIWQPDIIEVGAGTGLFSVEQASMSPDKLFLAIDVKADRLQKGALKAEERGLKNIRFLRARADQLIEVLPRHLGTTIWITFPDPFPKDRATKHRLTHPRFLEAYRNLLIPGGELLFKTDSRALFEWSLEQIAADGWMIKKLSFDLHSSDLKSSYKIMTTYEEKFHSQGLRISFLQAFAPLHVA